MTLYQAGPYLLDPFYHTAHERREGVFRMRELAPDRFFSSEYYRTYYVQTGLAEEIGFFVPVGGDITVVLSLMRREKTGAFPPAEFATLKKVEPLVASMVKQLLGRARAALRHAACRQRQEPPQKRGPPARRYRLARPQPHGPRNGNRRTGAAGPFVGSIGLKLNISTGTVKVHRRNVYRKLGISSQTQLLSLYLKNLS